MGPVVREASSELQACFLSFLEAYSTRPVWGQGSFAHFLGGFVFQVSEPEACDQMYESLARLHANYYKLKVSGPQSFVSSPLTGDDQ